MPTYTFPDAPSDPSGDWQVNLPGDSSIGEVLFYGTAMPPPAPTDYALYVSCETDYTKTAGTDPWTPGYTGTFVAGPTHPDGAGTVHANTSTGPVAVWNDHMVDPGGDMTFTGWVYAPTGGHVHFIAFQQLSSPVDYEWSHLFGEDTSNVQHDGYVTGGDFASYYAQLTGTFTMDAWHHYAARRIGTTGTDWDFAIDGTALPHQFHGGNTPGFAGHSLGFGMFGTAVIARVKRWARALTDGELDALRLSNQ
jgi:hypothetical protein